MTNMAIENRNWWEMEPWWAEWAAFGICAVWVSILPVFMIPMLVVSAVFGKIRWRVVLPSVIVGLLPYAVFAQVFERIFVPSVGSGAVLLVAVLILLKRDGAFKRNQL